MKIRKRQRRRKRIQIISCSKLKRSKMSHCLQTSELVMITRLVSRHSQQCQIHRNVIDTPKWEMIFLPKKKHKTPLQLTQTTTSTTTMISNSRVRHKNWKESTFLATTILHQQININWSHTMRGGVWRAAIRDYPLIMTHRISKIATIIFFNRHLFKWMMILRL